MMLSILHYLMDSFCAFPFGQGLCFVPIDPTVSSIAKEVTGKEQALNICRIEFTFYRRGNGAQRDKVTPGLLVEIGPKPRMKLSAFPAASR